MFIGVSMKRIIKNKKKILSTLLLTAFVLPAVMAAVPAGAASYDFSPVYKSSPYYERLKEYKLTGDMRYDLVSVALTQVGYHEGDCDDDMDGQNYAGGRNFVEYNRLYGKLDNGEGNGTSYGYAWCAAFVSWCLRQAGVPEATATTEVSCPRFIVFLESRNAYRIRESGYSPLPGDLIFFKSANSGATSTHIGIVRGTDGAAVYTVEGNADNNVTLRSYSLSDSYIVGYGIPDYNVKSGTVYDFPLVVTDPYPAGEYIVTADSLNRREGPGTSYSVNGSFSKGDRVVISEANGGWGKTSGGWISMSYTVQSDRISYRVTYKSVENVKVPSSQRKFAGNPLTLSADIPFLSGFVFFGWSVSASGEPDYMPGSVYEGNEDLTLYAVWKPEKIKISFYDSDGTTLLFEKEYDVGTDLRANPPDIPSKDPLGGTGYRFAGWSPELTKYVKWEASYNAVWEEFPISEETGTAENDVSEKGCSAGFFIPVPLVAAVLFSAGAGRKRKID